MRLYQTKTFCTAKETFDKMQREPMQWKKILANDANKGFISKIYLKTYITQHQRNKKIQLKLTENNGQKTRINTSPKRI